MTNNTIIELKQKIARISGFLFSLISILPGLWLLIKGINVKQEAING